MFLGAYTFVDTVAHMGARENVKCADMPDNWGFDALSAKEGGMGMAAKLRGE